MLTEKDYCDYETCVALKELGFNAPTEFYYAGDGDYITIGTSCRTDIIQMFSLYEAQKFLREEKGIAVDVSFSPFGYFASMYTNVRNVESEILKERFKFEWSEKLYGEEEHDSYEGALLEGIKEAVKILKEK